MEERDYDVYAEVESKYAGGRADVVGVSGPAVAVVEMKLTLSLDLIAQAVRWLPYANYVYIAVPRSKHRKMSGYASMFLQREGIGLLEVAEHGRTHVEVYNPVRAKFQRRINDHIRESLVPQHKQLPGGHSGGGYVTPYKLTMDRVREYMDRHKRMCNIRTDLSEWVSIRDILDHCETHYATPKPSLASALVKYEHDWCETKIESGKKYFRCKPS